MVPPPQKSDLRWLFDSIQSPIGREVVINQVRRAPTVRLKALKVRKIQSLIEGLRRDGYHGVAIDAMEQRLTTEFANAA